MQVLLSAALRGHGVAYGPAFVFGAHLEAGGLAPLLPDHRTSDLAIHAAYPTNRHVPPRLRRFIDDLATSLRPAPQPDAPVRIPA